MPGVVLLELCDERGRRVLRIVEMVPPAQRHRLREGGFRERQRDRGCAGELDERSASHASLPGSSKFPVFFCAFAVGVARGCGRASRAAAHAALRGPFPAGAVALYPVTSKQPGLDVKAF